MLTSLLLRIPYVGQLLRVSWLLFWDRRVFPLLKILPLAAVLYVLMPIDLLRDFRLGLGQIDDDIVAVVLLTLFVTLSPRRIVHEHIHGHDSDDEPQSIEGQFRYLDDE